MTTRAIDIVARQPWAVEPDALQTILDVAARLTDGPDAVAARLGRPLDNTRTVTHRDGLAVVPITGPIFRRANMLTEVSGATSVEILATDLQRAADDPSVREIILDIDSPGGQATGIAELASQIRGIDKPVTAYVDGMAASAAYWLAAAANRIVASPTALLGSIGVVVTYRAERDAPIKIISSQSPLKQAAPDTDAGRAELQRVTDELASIFIADVAKFRNVTPQTVESDFGRGGLLVGAAAVSAGMADATSTLEALISERIRIHEESTMSLHADICTALKLSADASADDITGALDAQRTNAYAEGHTAGHTAGHSAGQTAERERVSAILALVADKPHHAKLAHTAIAIGLDPEQAAGMIDAAPQALETTLQAVGAELPAPIPTDDSATGEGSDPEAAARRTWESDAALRAEFSGDFERYQAFQNATASGRVRILRK
jgi:ClpP class serine protease